MCIYAECVFGPVCAYRDRLCFDFAESLLEEVNDVMGDAGPHASTKGMSTAATHNLPHRTATLAVLLPLLALLIASCNFA